MPLCVYFFIAKLRLAHSIIQKKSGGSAPSPRGAAPGHHGGWGHVHAPFSKACNGQLGRAGHRKRKIYCLGGNFKFSGYGKIPNTYSIKEVRSILLEIVFAFRTPPEICSSLTETYCEMQTYCKMQSK